MRRKAIGKSSAPDVSEESNRRRVERVALPEPLGARLGELSVEITEIGLLGARVEGEELSDATLPNMLPLRFFWGGEQLTFDARLCYSDTFRGEFGETVQRLGLEFTKAHGESNRLVRELVTLHVMRMLAEVKANARGEGEASQPKSFFGADMFATADARPRRYLTFRFSPTGDWRRSAAESPEQPLDGFTVSADMKEEEIFQLQQQYEGADPSSRRLIRALAETSIADHKR